MTDELIQTEFYKGYLNNIQSRFYGLLCERERDGEWEKFLETIQIELNGFPPERQTINYYKLCAKVATLKYLRYEYFRKTIFECMNLTQGLN